MVTFFFIMFVLSTAGVLFFLTAEIPNGVAFSGIVMLISILGFWVSMFYGNTEEQTSTDKFIHCVKDVSEYTTIEKSIEICKEDNNE